MTASKIATPISAVVSSRASLVNSKGQGPTSSSSVSASSSHPHFSNLAMAKRKRSSPTTTIIPQVTVVKSSSRPSLSTAMRMTASCSSLPVAVFTLPSSSSSSSEATITTGSTLKVNPTFTNATTTISKSHTPKSVVLRQSPQALLEEMVQNVPGYAAAQVRRIQDVPSQYFTPFLKEHVDAYDLEILKAVRESDIPTLQDYHNQGRPLHCANRFGESLLHLACRKALVPVVRFLVEVAQVPIWVKDDMGRTPLADAFWTIEVNLEVVDLLLSRAPELFWVSDLRGHAPLSYARQEHWPLWCDYLQRKGATPFLPKRFQEEESSSQV